MSLRTKSKKWGPKWRHWRKQRQSRRGRVRAQNRLKMISNPRSSKSQTWLPRTANFRKRTRVWPNKTTCCGGRARRWRDWRQIWRITGKTRRNKGKWDWRPGALRTSCARSGTSWTERRARDSTWNSRSNRWDRRKMRWRRCRRKPGSTAPNCSRTTNSWSRWGSRSTGWRPQTRRLPRRTWTWSGRWRSWSWTWREPRSWRTSWTVSERMTRSRRRHYWKRRRLKMN